MSDVRDRFYRELVAYLRELRPGRDLPEPEADLHLWLAGYLDSFVMLQVVVWLEDVTARPIELAPDALPSFTTLRRIYDTYVAAS